MTNDTETDVAWLSEEDMAVTRSRMPIVYVDAVPVRVDSNGNVTEVGMLLRVAPDGNISRTFISGRVLYGERVRDALLRHTGCKNFHRRVFSGIHTVQPPQKAKSG